MVSRLCMTNVDACADLCVRLKHVNLSDGGGWPAVRPILETLRPQSMLSSQATQYHWLYCVYFLTLPCICSATQHSHLFRLGEKNGPLILWMCKCATGLQVPAEPCGTTACMKIAPVWKFQHSQGLCMAHTCAHMDRCACRALPGPEGQAEPFGPSAQIRLKKMETPKRRGGV